MSLALLGLTIWLLPLVVAGLFFRRLRRRRGRIGSAAGGVYEWLNEDKRRAVEVVAEGRAAATDPEDCEGQPQPPLGAPVRRSSASTIAPPGNAAHGR